MQDSHLSGPPSNSVSPDEERWWRIRTNWIRVLRAVWGGQARLRLLIRRYPEQFRAAPRLEYQLR